MYASPPEIIARKCDDVQDWPKTGRPGVSIPGGGHCGCTPPDQCGCVEAVWVLVDCGYGLQCVAD